MLLYTTPSRAIRTLNTKKESIALLHLEASQYSPPLPVLE
jgi:hypothetical protein